MFMVDLGGFAPPSRIRFNRLHTVLTYSIYLFVAFVNQEAINLPWVSFFAVVRG